MERSRDWSNEVLASLQWILIAFAITTVCFVVVAALIFRFTVWGRQFWAVSGRFYVGPGGWVSCLWVALQLLLTVGTVRLSVLISYMGNDLFASLQYGVQAVTQNESAAAATDMFWDTIRIFIVLAVLWVVRGSFDIYVSLAFDIRWRTWLTQRFTDDWLRDRAFYRGRFIDNTIDNPDQRIEEDITSFVTTSRQLARGGGTGIGAVGSILSIYSFTKILWDLSGPLDLFGITIPRAMMFILLAYVLITTIIAFWIGRPLIRLNFAQQALTGTFRYALVRLRDGAENVAFYRGERREHVGLMARFAKVIKNAWQIVYKTVQFSGWNFAVNQSAILFPYLIQGPRVLTGDITLGAFNQTSSAFGQVHDSLSFFRESYDTFTAYRASLARLHGLKVAGNESRELPKIAKVDQNEGLDVSGVDVRKPDGEVLIDDLSFRLVPGDALVVKGDSGAGKTTLLRTIAQMWPFGDGEVRYPDASDTMFLSQIPYIPLGNLRTVVAYPALPEEVDDDALRSALERVSLGHLAQRLDEDEDWVKILSPGEQQRVAFARILLVKPKLVFLDEATSSVDEGLEYALYQLIRSEVPECILVSVAHRSTVDQHHTQRLELEGDGTWQLAPVS